MPKNITRFGLTAGGLLAIAAVPSLASHSWSDYHWEMTGTEITIPVIDNTTGAWQQSSPFGSGGNYVAVANADWNGANNLNSPLSTGTADPSCPLRLSEIHVCNDAYGDTGWVGIASISISRGKNRHIVAGVTKLNDTYFDRQYYDTPTWRQLVTCQEIGHDYGLGHQNENFEADLTESCMEYTSEPAGNERPDSHDLDMLNLIYAHSHGGDDTSGPGPGNGGGKGKKLGVVGNTPADWGTPIAKDAKGRANVYRRDMNGYEILTHVTWAIGEGPETHRENSRFRVIEFNN
jgi:hypothetical protein